MDKNIALKTFRPNSSQKRVTGALKDSEMIVIADSDSEQKSLKKATMWRHDPTVRLSPDRQVDMSKLKTHHFARMDWTSHQIWDSRWSVREEAALTFRKLFRNGSGTQFSPESLRKTRDLLTRYFDNSTPGYRCHGSFN
jgi:hypothetical protein